MANQELHKSSAVRAVILLEFYYASPEVRHRYVIAEEDLTFGGNVYTALPTAEVKLPKINGSVEATSASIKMEELAFLTNLRSTWHNVTVEISEVIPEDDTSVYKLYKGEIQSSKFNVNGNTKVVELTIAGAKRRLEGTVSLPLMRFCPWTFGLDAPGPCKYDREANKDTGTISVVSGNQITVTGNSVNNPSLFRSGSIRKDGLEISINSQESLGVFVLTKPCPAAWEGASIDILPGCTKEHSVCVERDQEQWFGGMGQAIPDRDIRVVP